MTEPGYPPPGDLYGGSPPPPPMPPGAAAVPPLPWEDRERRGFFPALFETVKLFVTSPTEAFARAKESGDYLSPILFSVLIGWVATAIGQLYGLLFQGAWLSMLPPEMRDQLGPMMATGGFVEGGVRRNGSSPSGNPSSSRLIASACPTRPGPEHSSLSSRTPRLARIVSMPHLGSIARIRLRWRARRAPRGPWR